MWLCLMDMYTHVCALVVAVLLQLTKVRVCVSVCVCFITADQSACVYV